MKKIRQYILKSKEICIGLEDSKKTWRICARSGRTVVHETSLPAEYDNLRIICGTNFLIARYG
jgi:transposase